MSVWPARPLLVALAVWTFAAAAAVLLPWLWPAFVGALAALLALVAWDARLLAQRPPLSAARGLPARAFVGQEGQISLRLAHRGSLSVRASVLDELPGDVAPREPRFEDVVVPPGEGTTLRYAVRPRVRGDRALGPLLVFERSPLGLLRRRGRFAEGETLRVYPDTARFLRPAALDPQRLLAALGHKPARRRGDGMEFESLRDYVIGDDPRRLDWAASARRGRPVVRLYQHERNHVVLIALDASRLMGARAGDGTKLDCAVEAALALAVAGARLPRQGRARRLRPHAARLARAALPPLRARRLRRGAAPGSAASRGGRLRRAAPRALRAPAPARPRRAPHRLRGGRIGAPRRARGGAGPPPPRAPRRGARSDLRGARARRPGRGRASRRSSAASCSTTC